MTRFTRKVAARAFAHLAVLASIAAARPQATPPAPPAAPPGGAAGGAPSDEPAERGLKLHEAGACPGYTVIAPINSKEVHLVDLDGKIVHTWGTDYAPGAWLYILDNGHMLRGGRKETTTRFHGGGIGGVLQEIDWDSRVVWEYELANEDRMMHHEIEPMPNGNVLVIAWEQHAKDEATACGRDADQALDEGFWPDVIMELKPTRPKGAEVVWEWRAWDHLVQDRDPKKKFYGALRDNAGKIDINADHRYESKEETPEDKKKKEELERQMRAVGYVGGDDPADDAAAKEAAAKNKAAKDAASQPPSQNDAPPAPGAPPPMGPSGDFLHINAVAYSPEEDLILLSSPHLSEIWIIDHSTTTAQAASATGGRRGKGGEILWRWGNPQNYGHGAKTDQRLFGQHDPNWITDPKTHDLRLIVFNNGGGRPDGEYSSVDELVPPFDSKRGFTRENGKPFGPSAPAWTYSDKGHFYSGFISGAQRLSNGDTLICAGAPGRVFEVTHDGHVVWDYWNPLGGDVESPGRGGKAPPKALFRAVRLPPDHPAFAKRL